MDRDLLAHLPTVVAVAKHRSFVAAAGSLNMSASAVSHAVRVVEDRVGEALFSRTTRSVALTEAGKAFIERVSAALEDIGAAVEGLTADRGELTGVVKINAPRVAGHMALTRILAKMAWAHPRLIVEVHTNDAMIDIVAQGFDAGVRLGESVQQDMVAVRLTPPFKAIMVASPAYLRARGTPATLRELGRHNCVGFRLLASGSLYEWDVMDGDRPVTVKTRGTAVLTDAMLARDLALAGAGIAYIFEPLVREDLREGRLQWVLPQAAHPEGGLFLYYPRRISMSPKLKALVEVARSCVTG
jgi:DNA-binding transcriptional LysR family regulator